MGDLEKVIKNEARFAAIEHILSTVVAAILVGSGQTEKEWDQTSEEARESIRKLTFSRLPPEISDVTSSEIEDAANSLLLRVREQIELIRSKASHP